MKKSRLSLFEEWNETNPYETQGESLGEFKKPFSNFFINSGLGQQRIGDAILVLDPSDNMDTLALPIKAGGIKRVFVFVDLGVGYDSYSAFLF